MLSQGHMGAALFRYTGQVAPRFEDSGSLEEWKWCHNVMVEADIHFRPLHTSILDIDKVFETLVCCFKGIWVHPYSVTHRWLLLFHASVHTALQHQEVLAHHVPIWCTNLPFLVKPLAKDPLIPHHELAIVTTHCEHDLVEHALIDSKPCEFGNVVGIDLTFPIE